MDIHIFLIYFWITTVYQTECATPRGKPKRNELSESEPHPYTISFFTFPKGAASELLRSKTETKRENRVQAPEDSSVSETDDTSTDDSSRSGSFTGKVTSIASSKDPVIKRKKRPQTAVSHTRHVQKKNKHHQPFVQVYEKPNAIDKAGKSPEVGPQKGRQKMEPWKFGPSHNKIEFKVHQMEIDEAYQEGSINHPLHTMYPECHQCQSNSTYDECTSKNTIEKCNKGLNNICFTKSFKSITHGIVYEMGCSNHAECKKAKASPCKGNDKKCFVCCQYDGCNAVPHHYFDSSADASDDSGLMFSFNQAATYSSSKWNAGVLVFALIMFWMMT